MANAAANRLRNQIAGKAYAQWYRQACYFQEILLFMDCCRSQMRGAIVIPPHFVKDVTGADPGAVRYFYGFATKWSKPSRERPLPDPTSPVRGVFTAALLAALRGGAADAKGQVTALALGDYLFYRMKDFLSPADRANPAIAQEPDCIMPLGSNAWVIVDNLGPAIVTLTRVSPPSSAEVRLLDDKNRPVAPAAVAAPVWTFLLTPGMYLAQLMSAGGGQVLSQKMLALAGQRTLDEQL
jgi:hypothetical protein